MSQRPTVCILIFRLNEDEAGLLHDVGLLDYYCTLRVSISNSKDMMMVCTRTSVSAETLGQ